MITHLFGYPGAQLPSTVPEDVRTSVLPSAPRDAAAAIDQVLRDTSVGIIACWSFALAPLPWLQLARFASSLDDAWHPGQRLSGPDDDVLLKYVAPLWANRPSPAAIAAGAINWRLDLRGCFMRASALRAIRGLDGQFETLAGSARELGLRMMLRGAVCRQQPAMWSGPTAPSSPSPADRYRLVGRRLSRKWQAYALVRSVIDGQSPRTEWRGWRAARGDKPVAPAIGALTRPLDEVVLSDRIAVTVVLPTYGRYRYLAEVLEDVRAQTIQPIQIVICDGNPPQERDHKLYERFRDLPIEVVWDEAGGMCSARNACIQHSTGDYIWFVDDDSRFPADNLEAHLRVLAAYGADVSVGPAYTRGRPELHHEQREIACTFMDCGTTVCKRELLERVGGFDMQFNALLPGEDGELGVRFVRAGGLMMNNPYAKRFHYLAPVGGGRRSSNNLHRWSRWSLLPRPVQTIYYTARRHFEPGVERDAVLISGLSVGWRRREGERATLGWRLRTLFGELVALPVTAYRMRKSMQIGEAMLQAGAQIPPVSSERRRPAIKP
jgi:glycosyltransferase involved in cell wall biosynthesis